MGSFHGRALPYDLRPAPAHPVPPRAPRSARGARAPVRHARGAATDIPLGKLNESVDFIEYQCTNRYLAQINNLYLTNFYWEIR